MKGFSISLLCVSSIVGIVSAATSASSCYYPDGSLAPTSDKACNTTTSGHSGCCTAPCMSSGLCFDNGLVSRGSCTDSTWKDPACPQYCQDYNPTGGAPMILLGWAEGGDVANMGWCCGFPLSNGSCPEDQAQIRVAAGTVVGAVASLTSTSSGISTPTGTNSASNSTADKKCDDNNGVAIGVGVGVGVPLALAVGSLLFLWLRERKLRKNENIDGDKGSRGDYGVHQLSQAVPTEQRDTKFVPGPGNEYASPVMPAQYQYQHQQQSVELPQNQRIGELA